MGCCFKTSKKNTYHVRPEGVAGHIESIKYPNVHKLSKNYSPEHPDATVEIGDEWVKLSIFNTVSNTIIDPDGNTRDKNSGVITEVYNGKEKEEKEEMPEVLEE